MSSADRPPEPMRFITTVDDPGGLIQDLGQLRRVAEFYDSLQVPASFMVVPRGNGDWRLDRQPEWLAALKDAEARGHDCQLHGLDHHNCEFGPYARYIRALGGNDPDEHLKNDYARFGDIWTRETAQEKLRTALGIFEDALGRRPEVLRTGALSQHRGLYEAWANLGGKYVSNRVTDIRGWAYIIGKYDDPGDWDPDVPPYPYQLTDRVVDLPMMSEYAWEMTAEKVAPHAALAVEDLERVRTGGGVFILICHVQMVGSEEPYSRQTLERIIRSARDDYGVQFGTLRDLVAEIEAGAVPVAPHPQPDNIWRNNYGY